MGKDYVDSQFADLRYAAIRKDPPINHTAGDSRQVWGNMSQSRMDSHPTHRRDEPQPLGDVLSHLFTLRGYGRTGTQRQLGDIWRTLAGEQIADRTRVLGIKAGVLQIGVAGSAQLQEL